MDFDKFKSEFFAELDDNKFKESDKIKSIFRNAEFNHQTEYNARCNRCGCWFVEDGSGCPNCKSHYTKIE